MSGNPKLDGAPATLMETLIKTDSKSVFNECHVNSRLLFSKTVTSQDSAL
jgi:hypothetical protein